MLKGKSLDAKVGCVMYYAARNTKKNRKVSQILNYVNSSEKEMGKCFKKCKELLKFKPMEPKDIVDEVCQKLNYGPEISRDAETIAKNF